MPPGLRIYQNNIMGNSKQVERKTTFTFVLRATVGTDIHDRTYKIIIDGPDDPYGKLQKVDCPLEINQK